MSQFDDEIMLRAIALAKKGMNTTTPNPRVGCVIVDTQGEIIGEGFHHKAGEGHAEVNALAQAGARAQGATAYVTLEPCSHKGKTGPCSQALIDAGVKEVVFGMEDPNPQVSGRGIDALIDAGVEVRGPVRYEDVIALNPGFIKRMRMGIPFIRIKSAMSVDGRTAMASGESKWVTGRSARDDVQKIRARSCAIITGVESVIHDNPALTVRLGDNDRQPIRIIADTHCRCPAKSDILDQPGRTIIACGEDSYADALKTGTLASVEGREYWPIKERDGRIDLMALMRRLAQEGCNEVLVETGATLAGAFIGRGLVDEFIIYMAPKLLGSLARPLFSLPINTMSGELPLKILDMRAIGEDWRITAIPDPES